MTDMRKTKEIEKYCEYCGKRLERKRFNGRLEDFNVFQKRKYCDFECYRKGTLLIYRPDATWNNAHTTARAINKLILKRTQCEMCGAEGKLDVHHINEDWRDNSINNLQVLCRSCHTKLHKKDNVCIICGDKHKGYGYCDKHYQRYKKYLCPLYERNNEKCKNCNRNKEEQIKCRENLQ